MPTCLLGLGSNVGDSAATLSAAVADISALPDLQVTRHSAWHRTRAIGGPPEQADFLNGAAIVETKIPPLRLLAELQQIEGRHGRVRDVRWSPRTLDIDVLLYGNDVSETAMITLPHPRMTFRKFVLEPAVEIAPKTLHPIIGWPLERLLMHLNNASDLLAIMSPSQPLREQVAAALVANAKAQLSSRPKFETADHHWPPLWTTWIELPKTPASEGDEAKSVPQLPYAAAAFPKLSILLDGDVAHRGADKLQWSTLVRRPGRGPTLRLQTTDAAEIAAETTASVDAVWG